MLFSVEAMSEVVLGDCYGLSNHSAITKILDIGQCNGAFSLLARFRFPTAEVVGVEPFRAARETATRLLEPYGVHSLPICLGGGCEAVLVDCGFTQCNYTTSGNNGETVLSYSLADLFTLLGWKADAKTFVKVDCEGAERFIFEDRASRQILNSVNFAMEVHFPCGRHDRHNSYPEWQFYNNYFQAMNKTHWIEYGNSSKHNGVGIYRGKIKERWTFEKPNGGNGQDTRQD